MFNFLKKDKYYYKDGSVLDEYDSSKILHRVDGPAIEYTRGGKAWYINDKLHRTDGPAIEHSEGYKKWFIQDKEYTKEDYEKHIWILQYL